MQFLKSLWEFIARIFMSFLNVIAAFVVLICNLIVSFTHSLELFRSGGFHGGLEWVAVFAVEITFVMGGFNIVTSRMNGKSPGTPAKLGGLLGVLLVGWSNIRAGVDYGITGVILGAATPISLIIAEAILSHAFIQKPNKVEELEKVEKEKPKKQDPVKIKRVEKQPVVKVEDTSKVEDAKIEKVEKQPPWVEKMESVVEKQPPVKVENVEEKKPGQVEKVEKVEEFEESSSRSPIDWALLLHQQEGELPGRKRLMELSGCSEWQARKALSELKQKIS